MITASGSINLIEFDVGSLTYEILTAPNVAMTIQDITNSSGIAQRLTANNESAFVVYGSVTGQVVFTAGSNDGSIDFVAGASASESQFIGQGGYLSLRNFNGGTLNLGSIEGSGRIRSISPGPATLSVGGLNLDREYSGMITDNLALTKVGAGTLTLINAFNSYTGGTTFAGGAVSVAWDGALGAASGGLTFRGGTLQTTASFVTNRNVDLQVPSSGANIFSTATGTTLTVNGEVSGPGALVKDGAGRLVLADIDNSYTGGTALRAGTVSISDDANLGGASGLTFDGGTLQTTADITTARHACPGRRGHFRDRCRHHPDRQWRRQRHGSPDQGRRRHADADGCQHLHRRDTDDRRCPHRIGRRLDHPRHAGCAGERRHVQYSGRRGRHQQLRHYRRRVRRCRRHAGGRCRLHLDQRRRTAHRLQRQCNAHRLRWRERHQRQRLIRHIRDHRR